MYDVTFCISDWDYTADKQTRPFESLRKLNEFIEEVECNFVLINIIQIEDEW